MRHLKLKLKKLTSLSIVNTLLISLLAAIPIAVISAPNAEAVACSSSAAAQNNVTVTPVHGKIFYIDTGQNQNVDATYVGYKVAVSADKTNLWIRLDNFAGGAVSLANSLDANSPLGNIANGGSKMGYFLLKASRSSTLAQSHSVHVFSGRPDLPGSTELYNCTYTFLKVAETIKASANKVNSISNNITTLVAGSTFTITVRGYTGTIGQGSNLDGKIIWLSPASRSYWPTQALRLESTTIGLYNNKQYKNTVTNGDFTDVLYLKTLSNGGALANSYYYQANYVFRIIGQSAVAATVSPIAQISSGTQIKHTDMGSLPSASISTNTVTVDARLAKSASSTVSFSSSKVVISYTITLSNFSPSGSITVDQVVDAADPLLTLNTGTVRLNTSTVYPDPIIDSNGNWIFGTPISIPAANINGTPGTATLTYQMIAKTACSAGDINSYENSATGRIGSVVFASSATAATVVISGVTCNNTTATVTTNTTQLPVEVTTQPATTVATTSAVLNGTVDPNGQSGLATVFELSTDPNMSSGVTAVSLNTDSTTRTDVDPYAISQTASGLTSNTVYYFRTKVGTGSSAVYGAILSFQTLVIASNPTVVTTSASSVTTTSAILNGTINSNYISGGATAKFQWTTDPGSNGTCSNITSSTTVTVLDDTGAALVLYSASPTEVTYSLTGLTSGTYYCYRVMATYSTTSNVYGSWIAFRASNMLTQTITYNVPTFPGGATTMSINSTQSSSASADSGLTITYTSNTPSICTVDANGLITSAASGAGGTCSITASQPGNLTYYPATPVTITFQVVGTVILSYDLNGATGGSTPSSQTVSFGGTATVNNPAGSITRTNFNFAGWNTNSLGTGTDYAGGASITLNSNTTLYAKWTATITYNANSATGGTVPDPQTALAGLINLRSNSGSLVYTNFTFNGWNTQANGLGTHYAVGANYDLQGNVTLYAEWVPVGKYRVTYDGMGSDGGTVPSTVDVNQNSTYTVSSSLPTKTGWTFDGWYTTSTYTGGTRYVATNTFTVSANTYLYAMWKGSVTYNVNGATSGSNPATQNPYEKTSFTTAAGTGISKTYYTFSGWNTLATGDGDNFQASTSYTLLNSLSLYARWIPNNLTATFKDSLSNPQGHSADYTQTIPADTDTSLKLNTFSGTNLIFMGWCSVTVSPGSSCTGTTYADGATVKIFADTSYYAIWKSEVTVTYTAGSGGSIVGDTPQVLAAGQVTTQVTATPDSGNYFVSWNTASDLTSQDANRTDTVPSTNVTFTASFAAQQTPYLLWNNPSAITYGTTLSGTQLNAVVKTTSSGSTLTATCDYSPATGSLLAAGTQTLSVTCTPSNTQYKAISGVVSLVVNPKPITLTADNKAINYLGSTPTFSHTIDVSTPLVGSDAISGATYTFAKGTSDGYAAYAASTTAPTLAGVYSNTPSAAVFSTGTSSNYTITYVAGTYTINKIAQASITFSNQTYVALSTHTLVATGGSGTGSFSYAVTAGSCSIASVDQLTVASSGSCTVQATRALDRNYLVQTANSTITITLASWTLTAANNSYTQGGSVPTLTASASPSGGLSGSPDCKVYATADTGYVTALTINSSLTVGNYVIHCTGTASAGYATGTYVDGTLTVTNLLSWSITATSTTYTTPGTPPTASGTASPSGGLSGSLTCGFYTNSSHSTALSLSNSTSPGSYVVYCTGTAAAGYAAPSINDGVLTVSQTTWSLTAANASYTIGGSVPSLTATPSDLAALSGSAVCKVYGNGDTTYSSELTPISSLSAGTYVIHCTGSENTGYASANLINGTLTVSAPVSYVITIGTATGGSGSASPNSVGANGSTTLSTTANTGYTFTSWSCTSGSLSGSTLSGINANVTCTPTFTLNTYTLTYTAGAHGSITGSTPQTGVGYGSDGTAVTAVADTGYHFVNWSDALTANPRTDLSVHNDITVTANFAADNSYLVTYSDNEATEVIAVPTDNTSYADAATVTISATEPTRSGYTFNGWTTDSGNTGTVYKTGTANSTYTINSANVTFYAKWTADPVVSGGGSSGGGGGSTPVVTPRVPVVTAVAAKEVCASGVTLLIEGRNLAGATVTLDGAPVRVASSSDTALLLELPSGGIGTKTLKVFNADGSAATSIKYVLIDNPVYYNFLYPETYRGSAFTYTFAATNAYGYAVEGTLPDGLFLNPATGEVYGTPSREGNFKFALVALNPCGNSYLDVYMFVDKPIPPNYTCSVSFNVPTSNTITPAKVDALKSCLTRILTQAPSTIDPVIFLSGGVPLGSTIQQMISNPRYTQIVGIIDSLNIVAQIYVGAFTGPTDQVQVMVYWPVPLNV